MWWVGIQNCAINHCSWWLNSLKLQNRKRFINFYDQISSFLAACTVLLVIYWSHFFYCDWNLLTVNYLPLYCPISLFLQFVVQISTFQHYQWRILQNTVECGLLSSHMNSTFTFHKITILVTNMNKKEVAWKYF